jgi:hypothetical protein
VSTSLEIPIPLYSPVRFGSVLPGYVGFLRASPRVFSCLVQSYTHPSGDNYGDRYVWLSLLVPDAPQARTLGVRPSRLVARRCPQESSDVETFRLPIRPSARFSVLIPDLGGKAMLARQAETEPSGRRWPRMRNMPRCSICTDFMVAPEASVLKTDGEVSYLWSCDRCGHGFVTEARLPRF